MELKHFTGADVIAGDAFVLAYDVKNGNFGVVSKTDLVTALGSLNPSSFADNLDDNDLDGGFHRGLAIPETTAVRFGDGSSCIFLSKDSGQLYVARTNEAGGGPSATVLLSIAADGTMSAFSTTVEASGNGYKLHGLDAYFANQGDARALLYANGVPIKLETTGTDDIELAAAGQVKVNAIRVADDVSIGAGVIQAENNLALNTVGGAGTVSIGGALDAPIADANLTATDVVAAIIELAGRVAALE